ncbi:MAG: DUF3576 domain-containing protein [Geminicoccaceae bacterium]|nr:DUF3576 domain-containing protein [Geminicoccaceae bacterium]
MAHPAARSGSHVVGRSSGKFIFATALLLVLGACEGLDVQPAPHSEYDPRDQAEREERGTIFDGEGGIKFSTRGSEADAVGVGGGGLGVNAYLWRATLDTIDFMPLASADPFGGLIITEWYQTAAAPDERLKLHVLIKDAVLRADGIKVSMFRQTSDHAGGWLDAPANNATARALEDKILTRARELRIAEIGEPG